jgi:hypothetical protein
MEPDSSIELSIVMPCLNEAETLAGCIRAAHAGGRTASPQSYEIIVADNGSTDGSQQIAAAQGARVIQVPTRGYGAALQAGIRAACGRFVLIADSDASYDFSTIQPFIERLRAGCQLVVGTRIRGSILPGAMPFLHRRLGNPLLTALANLLFRTKLSDYHCGMRAFDREAILSLGLVTGGMEFASEMIIRASLAGLPVDEVPIIYYPDGRSRPPHLHTWRDGWRHLRFMLIFSPRWVLLYPGLLLVAAGLTATLILSAGPVRVGRVTFDVHTLLVATTTLVTGTLLILLAITSRAYASRVGLLPRSPRLEGFLDTFSLGIGLSAGILLILAGLALYFAGLVVWGETAFGPLLQLQRTLRIMIGGTTLITIGAELLFGSFVLSLLRLRTQGQPLA